jgi:PAS domain S-box-containing protein
MESLNDYRGILDDFAVGFVLVDEAGRVSFFNREAQKITGHAQAEALGRPLEETFTIAPPPAKSYLEEALEAGKRVLRKRCRIVQRGGKVLPVDLRIVVLRDRAQRLLGAMFSFIDDSARSVLEATLQQTQTLGDLIGRDAAMAQILEMLPVVAASEASILISARPAVGKGMVARAIHKRQPARPRALRQGQLRRAARAAAGVGAVRLPPGRLHRRPAEQARPLPARRGRQHLPRRDRRAAARGAGQAAAGPGTRASSSRWARRGR